jgi:hypothetical protein
MSIIFHIGKNVVDTKTVSESFSYDHTDLPDGPANGLTLGGNQLILSSQDLSLEPSQAHRYWRLRVTDANSSVCAINKIWGATSAGGPDVLASATVTTNSFQAGFEGTKAVDNDYATLWVSSGGASVGSPKDLLFDFGVNPQNWKAVEEIRIVTSGAWQPQAPADYTWGYSDDASTYTTTITVVDETRPGNGLPAGHYPAIHQSATCPDYLPGYLYYEVNITAGVDTTQCALGDIQFREFVSGLDMTDGFMVNWSQQAGGNPAYNAFDSDAGSSGGWFGTAGFPYTMAACLPERKPLGQVSLICYPDFGAYAPKTFTIRGSNNNSTWTTLISPADQTGWVNVTPKLFTP